MNHGSRSRNIPASSRFPVRSVRNPGSVRDRGAAAATGPRRLAAGGVIAVGRALRVLPAALAGPWRGAFRGLVWFACLGAAVPAALAVPQDFDLPSQPVAAALLAFSNQAKIEVLFSYDDLKDLQSTAVTGRHEPADALSHLLRGTGFAPRRNGRATFIVTRVRQATGTIAGRLVGEDGTAARGVRVIIAGERYATTTDAHGDFAFPAVPPGIYRLIAAGPGFQPLQLPSVRVETGRTLDLPPQTLQAATGLVRLAPYIVQGEPLRTYGHSQAFLAPPTAAGNLDLPRTEDDALPFTIYDRNQITRSGVINLNEFLQRELLDADASARPPDQNANKPSFVAGSTNLSLRGYGLDETVVLVNGRRLPEVLTDPGTPTLGPDVNLIPLSMVQQVEVLPVSASALYSGNAVGGVINIVLRPDADATEVTAAYTNALGGYDAPQTSISLLHGRSLLGGKLHLRLNANFSRTLPPTEAELDYHRGRVSTSAGSGDPIYAATPNVRSADGSPLFGAGSPTVTSVAPGADSTGGLAAFAGRAGVRSLDLFDSPGGMAASTNSLDFPYGRKQRRSAYYLSAVYDAFPWLQIGLDTTYAQTVVNRGYDVMTADLTLKGDSPLNPFGQDVKVSLNETAPLLGEDFSEAHLDSYSSMLGILVRLPSDWRVSMDTQYSRNVTRYRGLAPPDAGRWQQLVDEGLYNPLRDTQAFGPPPAFYDRALVYYGERGRFVTFSDYDTEDAALRFTNGSLRLPTGMGTVNLGGDYRRSHMAGFTDVQRFADGSLAEPPVEWTGRTLQRYSVFGELQAPLLPVRWLPSWIRGIDTDLAVRYVAADTARETNVAPTFGLKVGFAGGLSFRGSLTTSNRFPTPYMSRRTGSAGAGSGVDHAFITDPVRGQSYDVLAPSDLAPALHPESALTQTAGLLFQRGEVHRLRVALDFVDTRKVNELVFLDPNAVMDLETQLPGRVERAPLAAGDTHRAGFVTSVLTGTVNMAWRHSQNWNVSFDYAWTQCAGGTLEAYGRLVWFQRFDRQVFSDSPQVDELGRPDGAVSGLLRTRANFGAAWNNRRLGFGLDGHYFDARMLPAIEWASQGSDRIGSCLQFDAYLQCELGRLLPWKSSRVGLLAQLRVNNLFGPDFPKYAGDPSGAGVQAYGDWRGRTYSVSLTATF